MSDYIAAPGDGVVRASDGKFIARNTNDPEWQAFQDWQANGGALGEYVKPDDPWTWYIDIGPFFDRFGSVKMVILTSSNPIVKAILTDVSVRKWIDLKNPAVSAGLDALIAAGIPITADMKTAILTTPVTAIEQLAARKLYEG